MDAETETEDFGKQVVSRTEIYLAKLEECVGLLPRLLERYAAGEPYRDVVERIQSLESYCDRLNRHVSARITNAGPEETGLLNTRIYLNSSSLIELYQTLDEVANVAERIAEELVATTPPRDGDPLRHLREMADRAVTAMAALTEAVTTFVRLLCNRSESDSESITDEIGAVREIESACDGLRNDVIAAAFDDGTIDRPLLYRAFALRFDRLVDVMEDMTDRIVIVSDDAPEITTEPRRNRLSEP